MTGDWFAATATQVLVNSDVCAAVSLSPYERRWACGPVDGKCQGGDSEGEIIIDGAAGRFFAFNLWQYHRPTDWPADYCIPPSNISAYSLSRSARSAPFARPSSRGDCWSSLARVAWWPWRPDLLRCTS